VKWAWSKKPSSCASAGEIWLLVAGETVSRVVQPIAADHPFRTHSHVFAEQMLQAAQIHAKGSGFHISDTSLTLAVKDSKVEITPSAITIHASGSTIKIDGSGVSVNGTKISLNC
jgi:predicted nucleic acid-binding Zn ribbon protein